MKVVILGAGYSGIWAYRAVTRWMPRAEVTVISEYDFHAFHGYTGDAISGEIDPKYLHTPLAEALPKAKRITGKISRVDEAGQMVTVRHEASEQKIPYDHLVVATGARERTDHIAGIAEHGWHLRDPKCLPSLISHIDENITSHPDEAGRTVVVVGSGFTGTEAAVALAKRLKGRGHVILVTSSEKLIPHFATKKILQRYLHSNVHISKAEVRIGRAASVDAKGVTLSDGSYIAAHTVINASGNVAVVPAGLEHHLDERGMLKADSHMRVSQHIWAAGDVAANVNHKGDPIIKDALWATATGTKAGRNIARVVRKARTTPIRFIGLGQVATFYPGRSVASIWGIPLTGWLAYTIRQSVFFWFVPSRTNAVRVMRSFYASARAR